MECLLSRKAPPSFLELASVFMGDYLVQYIHMGDWSGAVLIFMADYLVEYKYS